MKLTTPYNFVPLSNKIYPASWADIVSQDIPFADGEDGTIEIEIKNMTPLFVRDGDAVKDGDGYYWSAHMMQNGHKQYFIPGTSLKGCFRSVLEILSFSKVSESDYNNDSFGYRDFDTQKSNYTKEVKGATCGWLVMKENENGDEEYFISECSKGIQKIKHETISNFFPGFYKGQDHETAQKKQESIANDTGLFPKLDLEEGEVTYTENKVEKIVPEGKYRVVCTGFMAKKNVEYLFSEDQAQAVKVDDAVIRTFLSVHKTTPYFAGLNNKNPFLKAKLEKGEPIPVFFKKVGGKIAYIGITAMFKFPFTYSIKDAVDNAQGTNFRGKDLATTIFGYIGKEESLKGRVQFSSAFIDSDIIIPDEACHKVDAVLGQPHPSFYPLYLSQKGKDGKLVRYSTEGLKIGGRKRYRIIKGSEPVTPNASEKTNVKTYFRPIPCGYTFKAKVNIHNLRKIEIGAILSALTFNMTPGTYHGIGMAKNLGYGKCQCTITGLKGLSCSVEDYIKAFNVEMSCFLQDNDSRLATDKSLSALASIASDTHTAADMKQLELKEFNGFKKPDCFTPLQEVAKQLNVLIDENEAYMSKIISELVGVDYLISNKRYDEASDIVDRLSIECIKHELPNDEVKNRREAIGKAREEERKAAELAQMQAEAERKEQEESDRKTALIASYSMSLQDLLAQSRYVATDLQKWTKVNPFGDSEYIVFRDFILSLDQKAQKAVMKKKNDIRKAIGAEYFTKLLSELK